MSKEALESGKDTNEGVDLAKLPFAQFGIGKSAFLIAPAIRETESKIQVGRGIAKSHITEFFIIRPDGRRLIQIERAGEGEKEIKEETAIREEISALIRERLNQKSGTLAFIGKLIGHDSGGSYNPKDGSLRIGQFHVNYSSDLAGKAIIFNGCLIRLVDAPVNAFELEWKKIPLVSAAVPPDKKLGPPDSFFH